jgi:hypothetical protein
VIWHQWITVEQNTVIWHQWITVEQNTVIWHQWITVEQNNKNTLLVLKFSHRVDKSFSYYKVKHYKQLITENKNQTLLAEHFWCFTYIYSSTLWQHCEKSPDRMNFSRNKMLLLYTQDLRKSIYFYSQTGFTNWKFNICILHQATLLSRRNNLNTKSVLFHCDSLMSDQCSVPLWFTDVRSQCFLTKTPC